MDQEALITLTADIVAVHVSHNTVAVGDIPALVQQVHGALSGLGTEAAAPAPGREPAVSARAAIKPDSITCMICGAKQKMLKRHLMTAHQSTPAQYRAEFGLKPDYPMVAPEYSEKRRNLAKSIGLGRLPRKVAAAVKGAVSGGSKGPGRGKRG